MLNPVHRDDVLSPGTGAVAGRNHGRTGGERSKLRDEVILLAKAHDAGPQETIVFLTNHLNLAAATVAAVCKDHSQIKLFIKALKRSLRLRTFVSTSPNAVSIRIRTARTTGACPISSRCSGSNPSSTTTEWPCRMSPLRHPENWRSPCRWRWPDLGQHGAQERGWFG